MDINNKLIEQWEPKINRMLQTTSIRGMDREDIAQELKDRMGEEKWKNMVDALESKGESLDQIIKK